MQNLSVNGDRLWSTIMETASFGGTPDGGVRRLALSEEDRQVRDWLVAACEAIGCSVHVDRLGSIFAFRPGSDETALPVAMGSHLDTQPTGGKFDGVLGVLAGLEVLRTLEERNVRTRHPLVLVNWTNEEGSRFAPAMMASGVHAGVFTPEEILARTDRDGMTVGSALASIGYDGPMAPGALSFDSMFELHIEQGPILEAEEKSVGVVTGVQGMRWFRLEVEGQAAHAGTTPMDLRRDALMAATEMMLEIRDAAIEHGALATFGTLSVENGSQNVIPGKVYLTLDLRSPDNDHLDAVESVVVSLAKDPRFARTPVRYECIWRKSPVTFDRACVEIVAQSAEAAGASSRPIVSGAGHDAAYVADIAPTAMIFVPCHDGLSHNPAESTTSQQCTIGAQVLLNAVLSRAGVDEAAPGAITE
jgi:N-carbamoyl-L-amino-acid hydrolase